MVGFEIFVNVPREKRQEFLQTFQMLEEATRCHRTCVRQALFESVDEHNRFLWVEHWRDSQALDNFFKSSRFGVLLGAISVLGEDIIEIKRLEMTDINMSKPLK